MLLVIFGAGASFDSAFPRLGARPLPLAKGLVEPDFDGIAAQLPASRPIIDHLRSRMRTNATAWSLETELAALMEASSDSPERRQQLVAFRFYLYRVIHETAAEWHRVTSGFTHYMTLLNHVYDWHKRTDNTPVRLATFNYDNLLDIACGDFFPSWNFEQLPSYVSREDFRLFKLHGSTEWSRDIEGRGTQGRSTIGAAMDLAGAGPLPGGTILARPPVEFIQPDAGIALPAMAIPMAGKTEFECPTEHIEALRAELPKVTHLLIVGWRAAEPHAVKLIEGSEPTEGIMPGYALGVVSGSEEDADEVRRNMGKVWEKGKLRLLETGGFSAFAGRLDEHLDQFLAPV